MLTKTEIEVCEAMEGILKHLPSGAPLTLSVECICRLKDAVEEVDTRLWSCLLHRSDSQ